MDNTNATTAHIDDVRREILDKLEWVGREVAGCNKRLDTVNGCISAHARQIAEINVLAADRSARIVGLEQRLKPDVGSAPALNQEQLSALIANALAAAALAADNKPFMTVGQGKWLKALVVTVIGATGSLISAIVWLVKSFQ